MGGKVITMKYNKLQDAYFGTGISNYKGILYTALDGLKYGDLNLVRLQLNKISKKLNQFISVTGIHHCLRTLPMVHREIDKYVRILSNTNILSFNAKVSVEEFLYSLLSAFGTVQYFCDYMHYKGF